MQTLPKHFSSNRIDPAVWVYLVVASLAFWVFGIQASRSHAMFFDETFTFHVANLGGPADVVRGLLGKADNHPPFDYLLRNFSMAVLGRNELGLRFPSLVFIYASFLVAFEYGRRACSPTAGVAASTALLLSSSLALATFGRVYGVVAGICWLAAFVWRSLLHDSPRNPWLWTAFGVLSGLAVCTHYVAVLFVLNIWLCTLLWLWQRRFVPKAAIAGVISAIAVGSLALPFALRAREYSAAFWTSRDMPSLLFTLRLGLEGYYPSVIVMLMTTAVIWLLAGTGDHPRSGVNLLLPERVLLLAMLTMPAQQFILARLVTHAWTLKYTEYSAIGGVLLMGLLAGTVIAERTRAAQIMALGCSLVAILAMRAELHRGETAAQVAHDADTLSSTAGRLDIPVIASSSNAYMRLFYYGDARLKKALIMPDSERAELSILGFNTDHICLGHLSRFVPLNFRSYDDLIQRHPKLALAHDSSNHFTWLRAQLLRDGFTVRVNPSAAIDGIDYVAERPPASSGSISTNGISSEISQR